MLALAQQHPSLAGRLAETLLKAWLSGDTVKLHTELVRSISISAAAHDTGEQECRQLLQAVARRMIECSDLLDPPIQRPELKLCAHLLWHLICPDQQTRAAAYRSTSAWCLPCRIHSPRNLGLPLIRHSTGEPAAWNNITTCPGSIASRSPMRSVEPASTASTPTLARRTAPRISSRTAAGASSAVAEADCRAARRARNAGTAMRKVSRAPSKSMRYSNTSIGSGPAAASLAPVDLQREPMPTSFQAVESSLASDSKISVRMCNSISVAARGPSALGGAPKTTLTRYATKPAEIAMSAWPRTGSAPSTSRHPPSSHDCTKALLESGWVAVSSAATGISRRLARSFAKLRTNFSWSPLTKAICPEGSAPGTQASYSAGSGTGRGPRAFSSKSFIITFSGVIRDN